MASPNTGSAGPSSGPRNGNRGFSGSKRPGPPNLEHAGPRSTHPPAAGIAGPAGPAEEAEAASAAASAAAANQLLIGEAPRAPVPLKIVVQQAVKRWFEDTLQEAQRGDAKQQALLGQMYSEGYGCDKDVRAAKEWTDRAVARGYNMQGVYCQI